MAIELILTVAGVIGLIMVLILTYESGYANGVRELKERENKVRRKVEEAAANYENDPLFVNWRRHQPRHPRIFIPLNTKAPLYPNSQSDRGKDQ